MSADMNTSKGAPCLICAKKLPDAPIETLTSAPGTSLLEGGGQFVDAIGQVGGGGDQQRAGARGRHAECHQQD